MSRISATGLKDEEFDEIKASNIEVGNNDIKIDETGLYVYHNYNILLPTVPTGWLNLHDEIESASISNTTQDLEILNLESSLATTQGNLNSLAVIVTGLTATTIPGIITNAGALALTKQDK